MKLNEVQPYDDFVQDRLSAAAAAAPALRRPAVSPLGASALHAVETRGRKIPLQVEVAELVREEAADTAERLEAAGIEPAWQMDGGRGWLLFMQFHPNEDYEYSVNLNRKSNRITPMSGAALGEDGHLYAWRGGILHGVQPGEYRSAADTYNRIGGERRLPGEPTAQEIRMHRARQIIETPAQRLIGDEAIMPFSSISHDGEDFDASRLAFWRNLLTGPLAGQQVPFRRPTEQLIDFDVR